MDKEALILDADGFFKDVTLVAADVTGVFPMYRTIEIEQIESEEPQEPQQELTGYQVAVPVPSGLYKPKFDITGWQFAIDTYNSALEAYYVAMTVFVPDESEGDPPQPPMQVNLSSFWIEGYTQEELDAIRNAPVPLSVDDKINTLNENVDNNSNLIIDSMDAIAQIYEEKEQQLAQKEQDILNAMDAIAELYEQILTIQAQLAGGTT